LRVTLGPDAPVDREIVTALLRRLLDHGVASRARRSRRGLPRGPLPDHDHPARGALLMFDPRLISAEVLKLRRRRGMLSIALLGTLGAMLIGFTVLVIQHSSDPGKYGPAGGLANYQGAIDFLALMALVAGAIIGATAGTQDVESGVFRISPPPGARGWHCSARA
jgi:hypothetical protein